MRYTSQYRRHWAVEGCHAIGRARPVGHHVVGGGPDEPTELDHQGRMVSGTPVCMCLSLLSYAPSCIRFVSNTSCILYLHVAEVDHVRRAFLLLGNFHRIRSIHPCAHRVYSSAASECLQSMHVHVGRTIPAYAAECTASCLSCEACIGGWGAGSRRQEAAGGVP